MLHYKTHFYIDGVKGVQLYKISVAYTHEIVINSIMGIPLNTIVCNDWCHYVLN